MAYGFLADVMIFLAINRINHHHRQHNFSFHFFKEKGACFLIYKILSYCKLRNQLTGRLTIAQSNSWPNDWLTDILIDID